MKAIVGNPEGINLKKPTAVVIVGVELSELQHAFSLAGISMHEFPFSAFSGNPEGNEIVERLNSSDGITILVACLEDLENFRASPEVVNGSDKLAQALAEVFLRFGADRRIPISEDELEQAVDWCSAGGEGMPVPEAIKNFVQALLNDGGKPPSSSS